MVKKIVENKNVYELRIWKTFQTFHYCNSWHYISGKNHDFIATRPKKTTAHPIKLACNKSSQPKTKNKVVKLQNRLGAAKLLDWLGFAWLAQWQNGTRWTILVVHERRSRRCYDILLWLWDLNNLRFRLADECLTDFLRLNDGAWLAHDFWVGNASLHVDDLRFRHDALLIDNDRLTDDTRLIDEFWLADFLRFRHDMLVDHSALWVNDFFLADDAWRLLDSHEVRSALLWWADVWALWHRVDVVGRHVLWSALV